MNISEQKYYSRFSSPVHYRDYQLAVQSGRLPDGSTTDGNLSAASLAAKTDPETAPSGPVSLDKTGQLDKLRNKSDCLVENGPYSDGEKYCTCPECLRSKSEQAENFASVYDSETLQKKAVAKAVSFELAHALHKIPDSPLRKAYGRTLNCANYHYVADGKITAEYCKSRWCLVCNRIRTAELINTYVPIISTWENPHMLTLTIPNCSGFALGDTLDNMHSAWTSINRLLKRGRKREVTETITGKEGAEHEVIKDWAFPPQHFQALRKIECTYNIERGDYHPHYHIVFDNPETARLAKEEWLKRFPKASEDAQDLRPVDKSDFGGLKELFKYFTKIFSAVKDKDGEKLYTAHVDRLDVIFQAMDRKRTLQPYGFRKADYKEEIERFNLADTVIENLEEQQIEELISFEPEKYDQEYVATDGVYRWDAEKLAWKEWRTGTDLVKFEASEKLLQLIDNIYIYGVKSTDFDLHPMETLNILSARASPG